MDGVNLGSDVFKVTPILTQFIQKNRYTFVFTFKSNIHPATYILLISGTKFITMLVKFH